MADDSGFNIDSLLGDASKIISSGAGIYNTVTGNNGKTTTGSGAPAASPSASSSSSISKFLPWIAGGAVVVIGALFFLFRKK